jgi:phage shock protein E
MENSVLAANLFKWILALGGTVLLVVTAMAFSASRATAGDSEKSREEIGWELISNGALLVDVRTEAEFESGHLEGALLIPFDETAERVAEYGTDKDRPIVLYCRSGNRAGKAEKTLNDLGFTKVHNAGGYEAMKAIEPK